MKKKVSLSIHEISLTRHSHHNIEAKYKKKSVDGKSFLAIYVHRLIDFQAQNLLETMNELRYTIKVGCVTKQKTTYNTSSADKLQS